MTNVTVPAAPAVPKIPSGQEIYDAIMAYIEPDLTTAGSQQLKEKYKAETPEQFKARKKRYALAYDRYAQAYEGYMNMLNAQVDRYRRDSFAYAEVEDRAEEGQYLQQLASLFA